MAQFILLSVSLMNFVVEPACGKLNLVASFCSSMYVCVFVRAVVHPSGFVWNHILLKLCEISK